MLAGLGAKVTIFDLNEEVGEAHAAVIGGLFARVDVADEESGSAGLDAAGSAYGITRLLVNCAGVAPAIKTVGKENAPHPLGAFRRAVEINLVGSFNVIDRKSTRLNSSHYCAPRMPSSA